MPKNIWKLLACLSASTRTEMIEVRAWKTPVSAQNIYSWRNTTSYYCWTDREIKSWNTSSSQKPRVLCWRRPPLPHINIFFFSLCSCSQTGAYLQFSGLWDCETGPCPRPTSTRRFLHGVQFWSGLLGRGVDPPPLFSHPTPALDSSPLGPRSFSSFHAILLAPSCSPITHPYTPTACATCFIQGT